MPARFFSYTEMLACFSEGASSSEYCIQLSDLSIVGPLVGHVEGGLDGAAVGVVAAPEEVLVELLVQVVDGVVEGEEDELRDLVCRVAAGDVAAAAVAVLRRFIRTRLTRDN